uniref:Uncharacterized protein n=1 Tax=Meloidogyne enterolobii TaxID=390850 RepID=A0A6V7W379_MELEN|nr:unnamed protein product [Meloidogyne enterolobii]
MFSSSTKICLFFLSIFILFQLNNASVETDTNENGCPDGICSNKAKCLDPGRVCVQNSTPKCCPGHSCQKQGEFNSYICMRKC